MYIYNYICVYVQRYEHLSSPPSQTPLRTAPLKPFHRCRTTKRGDRNATVVPPRANNVLAKVFVKMFVNNNKSHIYIYIHIYIYAPIYDYIYTYM